jgi:hypothetical protein
MRAFKPVSMRDHFSFLILNSVNFTFFNKPKPSGALGVTKELIIYELNI